MPEHEDIGEHPLLGILKQYCAEYKDLREANLELDNAAFHRRFGLSLHVPESWPMLECLSELYGFLDKRKVVVIFPTTQSYLEIHEKLSRDVSYFSWHEIYAAIHLSSHDIRTWQQIKSVLSNADYVLFLRASNSATEVNDQVRANVNGCLVSLG